MKIGILTVHFADYGSYYQAISLCEQLRKMGHQAEIIHESYQYKRSPRLIAGSIASRIFPAKRLRWLGKIFTEYNTYLVLKNDLENGPVSKPVLRTAKRYAPYDCVVVGSDELWSVIVNNIRFVPDYFGLGISCPHIAYGVSGIRLKERQISPKRKNKLTAGLRTFDSLSARDIITKNWVENWLERPGACAYVLDPTLLNPFFVQKASVQPMVAVYGQHYLDEQKQLIVSYAREKGYRLLAISWPHDWCDDYLDATCAADIQRAFSQAAYCAVSTFHGTVFSILARRPFVSFMTEARGAKVFALLSELELTDRLYSAEMKGKLPDEEIDFDAVEKILTKRREESLQYLSAALRQVEEAKRHVM